ncbi:MAG: EAL domain-containing protein [Lachnospiraceae bacterium]|jgi:diguanylate cyclase (GGDEF)-like protein|nr:EAL domain-containing protein [Lachnospiraceae bacterium]
MKNKRPVKWPVYLLIFMLALSMLEGIAPDTVYAKGKRTVKVAFFPMSGYNEKGADGKYTGMDVEYLDELCRYANWEIQYVECQSWDEALRLVSEKKADLVGSAQYSSDRAAVYQYADLSSGYTFGIIATDPGSMIAYEDFEAMKGITFGMVRTYVRKNEFFTYLSDNGIRSPKVKTYDSTAKLQEGLKKGEIDAMVHTFMEIQDGQRLIGRFAPRPFYYLTYPGNDDVMRELNQAIADLKMNDPSLETRLMNEFYQSRLDKTIVFTTDEKKYISEANQVKVGYFDKYYPFLYTENGECKGLTRDLLEGAAAVSGLSLSWQEFETPQKAHEALTNGVIDILSNCPHTEKELDPFHLVKMKDYAQVPMVLIMQDSKDLNSINKLALVAHLASEADNVIDLETTALLICNNQEESLDMVKNKKADAALCDGYLAEYLLSAQLRYYDLEIKSVLSGQHGLSMAVRSDDYLLAGILNKTLLSVDARAVNDYMLERNVHSLASMGQFIQNHSAAIIAALFLLIIVIILVAVHIVRDTMKIQKLMYKDVELNTGNLNYLIYQGENLLPSERSKLQYAVVYINIAQFQNYKVVYGWNNGQKLLRSVADTLCRMVNEKTEICARADGDHFALLLSPENGNIVERLKEIEHSVKEQVFLDTGNHISLQIGVYYIPFDKHDLREAVVCASQAIEYAKDRSTESIMVYDSSLENTIRERHEKERMLDSVDIEKNFIAYYQAKIDVLTEKIVGAEALVRYIDPTAPGKVISPGFFVPYYEQTGRITEIDFFILRCVCKMLRRRLDQGEAVVTISCNFSRLHFIKPDFAQRFENVLNEYQIPKELVEVEITETMVVEEMEAKTAEQTLEDLHRRGIRLSIDDFGSGYSSLGVIEKIPASVIKLDRSFLLNQEDRDRQVKIMKSIVDLAGNLGAQIVCEGVETDADVDLMREIGARVAQGYRYSRPVPETEFENRLSHEIK